MLTVNNNTKQPAFTAHLKLNRVKTGLNQWQKADKILQEKTQKIMILRFILKNFLMETLFTDFLRTE